MISTVSRNSNCGFEVHADSFTNEYNIYIFFLSGSNIVFSVWRLHLPEISAKANKTKTLMTAGNTNGISVEVQKNASTLTLLFN